MANSDGGLRATPPGDLDQEGPAAWKHFCGLLVDRGWWDAASPELLDECVRSLQDARGARDRIAARWRSWATCRRRGG
jgi:hypothetical protein